MSSADDDQPEPEAEDADDVGVARLVMDVGVIASVRGVRVGGWSAMISAPSSAAARRVR